MAEAVSPTARALLALELLQGSPGITAERLADRLGVSERAARRYVAVLREAGIPVESVRGPYGGYRLGRGSGLPPVVFSEHEALALVMSVLESHPAAARADDDPVGAALTKILRVLPASVGRQAAALRTHAAAAPDRRQERPDLLGEEVRLLPGREVVALADPPLDPPEDAEHSGRGGNNRHAIAPSTLPIAVAVRLGGVLDPLAVRHRLASVRVVSSRAEARSPSMSSAA